MPLWFFGLLFLYSCIYYVACYSHHLHIFLISDCARRSPGKHSCLFWEPRQFFFELVWKLRRYGLCSTYEPVHLILLGWIVSSVLQDFPLGLRPCSSFFKVHRLGSFIHVMCNGFVAFGSPSALQPRPSIVTTFTILLTLM